MYILIIFITQNNYFLTWKKNIHRPVVQLEAAGVNFTE